MPTLPTIDDLVDEIEEWLKDVEETVDDNPLATVPGATRDSIAALLASVEGNINQILDPDMDPMLAPPDAGSVDSSITPSTATGYAQAVHELAAQASAEAHAVNPDDILIGSRLKTIKHLLIGFRDALGI